MTNKESFEIHGSSSKSAATLSIYGIDPILEDKNKLSMAYGMFSAATNSEIKIGDTSEKLSVSAINSLLAQANAIFKEEGVIPPINNTPKISAVTW